jgi:hypothetical protein
MRIRFSHSLFCAKWPALAVLVLLAAGCGRREKPVIQNPDYKAEIMFKEDFSRDLRAWYVMGQGLAQITADSTLHLQLGPQSDYLVFWSVRDVTGNFQVEYTVRFPDSCGSHVVLFCAQGAAGEDITRMTPPPPDAIEMFFKDSIASYQVSCHNYDSFNLHQSNSRVRKNPGNLLFAGEGSDPCPDNRDYLIDLFKIDNRIQIDVDGLQVHDLRDRGGFGPTYMTGKIGFMIRGRPGVFGVFIDDIRVFKLTPR